MCGSGEEGINKVGICCRNKNTVLVFLHQDASSLSVVQGCFLSAGLGFGAYFACFFPALHQFFFFFLIPFA